MGIKQSTLTTCRSNLLKHVKIRKDQTDKHSPERNSASLIGEEIDLSMESLTADDTDEEENKTAVVEYNTDEEQNVKEVVVNCTDKEEIKQIVKGYDTDENKNTP